MVEKPELLAHLRASIGADVGGVSPLHGAYPAAARARGLCDVPSATKTAKHEPTNTTASASAFASARACVQSTTKGGAGFCLPRGALRDGHRLIHSENLPPGTCFGRQGHTTARATLRCVRTLRESARKHRWNGCGGGRTIRRDLPSTPGSFGSTSTAPRNSSSCEYTTVRSSTLHYQCRTVPVP